jgi:hypothetical protein
VRTAADIFGWAEAADGNRDATALEGRTSSTDTVAGLLSTGEPDTEAAALRIDWKWTVAARQDGKEVY